MPSHEVRGWHRRGQCTLSQRSCPPLSPLTLNLDHLTSCYSLFYVKGYRLKLSSYVCKGAFSSIARNVIVIIFQVASYSLLPLWHYKGHSQRKGRGDQNISDWSPQTPSFPACPISALFIFRCDCHNHSAWLPPSVF